MKNAKCKMQNAKKKKKKKSSIYSADIVDLKLLQSDWQKVF